MPPPKHDRKEIAEFHKTANGTGSSSSNPSMNYRDASGSAPDVWKNPKPTRITLPSNAKIPPSSNNVRGLDPYTRHLSFNPAATATFTAPRTYKRQRLERRDPLSVRTFPVQSKGKGKEEPRFAPEITMIDDSGEDLGKPLPPSSHHLTHLSSPDPLDSIPRPKTSCLDSKLVQNTPIPLDHPFNRTGENRGSIDQLRQTHGQLSSDPVEDFPPSPPGVSRIRDVGFVQHEIRRINASSGVPHFDFSKRKDRMKPKTNTLKITPVQPNIERTPLAPRVERNVSSEDTLGLRTMLKVKEAYIGVSQCPCSDVRLKEDTIGSSLLLGFPGEHAPFLTLRLDTDISHITLTTCDADSPALRLTTINTTNTSNYRQTWYEPGHPERGIILLVFHPEQRAQYAALFEVLKSSVKQQDFVDSNGMRAMCDSWKRNERLTKDRYPDSSATQPRRTGFVSKPISGIKRKLSPDRESLSAPPPSEFPSQGAPTDQSISMEDSSVSAPLRRSARHAGRKEPSPTSSKLDAEEIILVYPPNTTGAVTIKNSDLLRLQPGEFLNDTLIEFGLKLWLRELEEVHPDLAKDVHVFNSFFYKKLKVKNVQEGYKSVRKWTSKFDLFRKKYIIVPINENLHWYLAVIYEPEHVLRPREPVKEPPRTRRQSGRRNDVLKQSRDSSTQSLSQKVSDSELIVLTSDLALSSRSGSPPSELQEAEVEEQLVPHSDDVELVGGGPGHCEPRESSPLSAPPDDEMTNNAIADDQSVDEIPNRGLWGPTETTSRHVITEEDISMSDGEATVGSVHSAQDHNVDMHSARPEPRINAPPSDPAGKGISVTKFYGRQSKAMHPHVVPSTPPDPVIDNDPGQPELELLDNTVPRSYIFTLDSLGTKHISVGKTLNMYLKLEAKDKKGIDVSQSSDAQAIQAFVPVQPNSCDCGIYLLHFAQTFMKDPQKYCRIILTRRSGYDMRSRQVDWDDASVGHYRENLANRIVSLSRQWKEGRTPIGPEAVQAESIADAPESTDSVNGTAPNFGRPETEVVPDSEESDGSIEFVEMKSAPVRGRGRGRGRGGITSKPPIKAARLRG